MTDCLTVELHGYGTDDVLIFFIMAGIWGILMLVDRMWRRE